MREIDIMSTDEIIEHLMGRFEHAVFVAYQTLWEPHADEIDEQEPTVCRLRGDTRVCTKLSLYASIESLARDEE